MAPKAPGPATASGTSGSTGETTELTEDKRARDLLMKATIEYADMMDDAAEAIKVIAVKAIKTHVLDKTKKKNVQEADLPWLEREVERTRVMDIAKQIKLDIEAMEGGAWHVIFGRNFACYCTYEVQRFVHIKLGDASVTAWKHG